MKFIKRRENVTELEEKALVERKILEGDKAFEQVSKKKFSFGFSKKPKKQIEVEISKQSKYAELSQNDLTIKYRELQSLYAIKPDEEIRNQMIEISDLLKPVETQKEKKPKRKFSLGKRQSMVIELGITKKEFKKLEIYCGYCKHEIQDHEYKGRSEGCKFCGCLKSLKDIFEYAKEEGYDIETKEIKEAN